MRTDRLTRSPRPPDSDQLPPIVAGPATPPAASTPVDRQVVDIPTKEIRERCTSCGVYVAFRVLRTRDAIRYVRCPHCGHDHALNTATDTIRPVR